MTTILLFQCFQHRRESACHSFLPLFHPPVRISYHCLNLNLVIDRLLLLLLEYLQHLLRFPLQLLLLAWEMIMILALLRWIQRFVFVKVGPPLHLEFQKRHPHVHSDVHQ